jgi:tetratricopeptide (TPR) repeat protein
LGNSVATRPAARKAASRSLPGSASQPEQTFAQKVGLLVNAGRSEEAWHVVNRAVEREPLSPEAHYLAAFVHWHRVSLDDALACLGKAIYLDPGCVAAHQMRGLLLVQKGQVDRARRAFQMAYQLAMRLPDDAAIDFGEGATAAQLARAAQSQIRSLQDSGGTR